MSEAIPIIACGKIPGHQKLIPQLLKPELEVLQEVFPIVEAFTAAFPVLFASETKKPVAVVMGEGFDQEEFDRAYSIPGGFSVPWMRPLFRRPGNEDMIKIRQTASAEGIASSLKIAIKGHHAELEAREGAGEV